MLSQLGLAIPSTSEVWFLSEKKSVSQILEKLFPNLAQRMTPMKVVQNQTHIGRGCMKMGDKFFHPQYGVHDHEGVVPGVFQEVLKDGEEKKIDLEKGLANMNSDLIECDRDYHFDFFCGNAQKSPEMNPGLEIWVDVSSSFKAIDFEKDDTCHRKRFVNEIRRACGDKVSVYTFDTSIKRISGSQNTCMSYGSNDPKRLVDWISRSKALHLVIITDISEYNAFLDEYFSQIGTILNGEKPGKEFIASEMLDRVSKLTEICKKF